MKKLLTLLMFSSIALADSPYLIDDNGVYLGNLNSNRFDPNSVSNPYGRYGNKFSPDSINNKFGKYGNRFSPDSVTNPYGSGLRIIGE